MVAESKETSSRNTQLKSYEKLKDFLPFQSLCGKVQYLLNRCEGDAELQDRLTTEIKPLVIALQNVGFTGDQIFEAWVHVFEDLDS